RRARSEDAVIPACRPQFPVLRPSEIGVHLHGDWRSAERPAVPIRSTQSQLQPAHGETQILPAPASANRPILRWPKQVFAFRPSSELGSPLAAVAANSLVRHLAGAARHW